MNALLTLIKLKTHYVLNHVGFVRYGQNIWWAFAGRFFSLGISFFIGALVARYLGPTDYGALNYAISFVSIFAFITSFGIDYTLGRDILEQKEKQKTIIDTAYGIKLIGGSIATLIIAILGISGLIGNNTVTVLTVIYSSQLLISAFSVTNSFFQSIPDHKTIFYSQFISTILVSVIKLVFIGSKFGVAWFSVALVLETLVAAAITNSYFKKHHKPLNTRLDFLESKKMLADSWPFIFISAFYLIYSRIDQIFIEKMLGSKELGIYVSGVKLAEIWYFLPAMICTVFMPAIMNAREVSIASYNRRIKWLTILMLGGAILIALFETVFSQQLIHIMFGNQYLEAAKILSIYAWAGVPISLMMVIQQKLTVERKNKTILTASFVGMIVNVVLNITLIPLFGIIGSAWATLISYSTIPVISWAMTRSKSSAHE